MHIDEISVRIDDHLAYKFECPADSLCPPPFERVIIDDDLMGEGEHAISIEVLGSGPSFALVGIERDLSWEPSNGAP
jgi:hypothetical protein